MCSNNLLNVILLSNADTNLKSSIIHVRLYNFCLLHLPHARASGEKERRGEERKKAVFNLIIYQNTVYNNSRHGVKKGKNENVSVE